MSWTKRSAPPTPREAWRKAILSAGLPAEFCTGAHGSTVGPGGECARGLAIPSAEPRDPPARRGFPLPATPGGDYHRARVPVCPVLSEPPSGTIQPIERPTPMSAADVGSRKQLRAAGACDRPAIAPATPAVSASPAMVHRCRGRISRVGPRRACAPCGRARRPGAQDAGAVGSVCTPARGHAAGCPTAWVRRER